ncbi:Lrp/AsnC family transcriptional regulator [Paenibacillus sp. PK4536]|uniref:Putative HTH-type transcriptional regulator n=1 Tax=Paenibacillus nuruki TaxID=1886670 RepID=A0A1E3KYK7_9BACL|nr:MULTISPECIES: Lrp/AsnC family transcriptional regulator [Paenibacillus]ODP26411.1 putative HTH-type transcriptional regulator [Paenibacillus nuruki]TKJ84123.1 Lrp/AsnC family transcriptional regulator [Paenibacillus sp. CFBP13512]WIM40719.1 Lrp/AsnC family transcriptional regulator [Paenibacillus sp. PK4536]CAJ1316932.1 Lrp/AsnC family transcriptional regulator [Paenibacillus nuruki]
MDQVDQHILLCLQTQARISMTELGKEVGLSQPAVTERVRRMEESGVIQQYRAVVAPDKIGQHTTAYYLFRAHDGISFVQFCQDTAQIVECHRVSGDYNYLIKVVTASIMDLEPFENCITSHGSYTTLITLSSPIDHKSLVPAMSKDQQTI